jgi:hypothetical protein
MEEKRKPKPYKRGPKSGLAVGTFRKTEGSSINTFMIRDDLKAIVKAKANTDKRTIRNVVECALYYYCGGEELPIAHPDDPSLADRNRKRIKAAGQEENRETTHLDVKNREAMERARAREEQLRKDRDNPWNQ